MSAVDRGQGDAEAFSQIWAREQKQLYSLCLHWTGGRQADSEDVLSQLAIKALEMLPERSSSITNYTAWLTSVAKNLCFDLHRQRESYQRALDRFAAEERVTLAPAAEPPEVAHQRAELTEQVRQAIEALPPLLREACRLHVLHDSSYQEIADALSLSNQTVRKRLQLARARIGEALAAYLRSADARPAPTPAGRAGPAELTGRCSEPAAGSGKSARAPRGCAR